MSTQPNATASLRSYITGYVLSLGTVFVAFGLVAYHNQNHHTGLSHRAVVASVIVLAIVQFIIQAVYFLHLHRDSKPRWNLMVFGFMLLVVSIVTLGSLWIMRSLDYNMQPDQVDQQIIEDEGINPR